MRQLIAQRSHVLPGPYSSTEVLLWSHVLALV